MAVLYTTQHSSIPTLDSSIVLSVFIGISRVKPSKSMFSSAPVCTSFIEISSDANANQKGPAANRDVFPLSSFPAIVVL